MRSNSPVNEMAESSIGLSDRLTDLVQQRHLVSPYDGSALSLADGGLLSEGGHRFPIIEGVPVMLRWDKAPNFDKQFELTRGFVDGYDKGTLELPDFYGDPDKTIRLYKEAQGAFAGKMYDGAGFRRFSIPNPPLRSWGYGRSFLDVGSGWGRFCFGAQLNGYNAFGVDPSLYNLLFGKSIAKLLGLEYDAIAADGRYLPFSDGAFEAINSWGMLHHLSDENYELVIREIGRVLRAGGDSVLQISNLWSPRHFLLMSRRADYDKEQFGVRFRSPPQIRQTLGALIGETEIFAHGYFTISNCIADNDIITRKFVPMNTVSHYLGTLANWLRFPRYFADSVYARSTKAS